VEKFPAVPDHRSGLGAYLNDQALLEQDRGNLPEARQLLEEAINHQQIALKVNQQNPRYRSRLRAHYANLGQVLLSLGDHAATANAAEKLAEVSFGNWSNTDLAFRILAQCGPLALKDTAIPEEKRQSLSQAYRKRARELLRRVIERPPTEADAKNSLAWTLVTLPDPSLQDPAWAVQMAQQAVEQAKQNKGYWNTLGVARYRARDWTGATAALEKSCQLGRGGDGFDWIFLAMVRWQMGDKEQARHWYSQAVSWQENNAPQNEELRRFRAEAALLLDIQQQALKNKEEASPKK
jgi:tetratricopeptide (TPR) repeat protein